MPTLFNSVPSLHDRIRQLLLESQHLSTPYAILSRSPETLVELLLQQQQRGGDDDDDDNNNDQNKRTGNPHTHHQQQQQQQHKRQLDPQQHKQLLEQVERLRYQISESIFAKTLVGQKRKRRNAGSPTAAKSSSSFLPLGGMAINALEWQRSDNNHERDQEDGEDDDEDELIKCLLSETIMNTMSTSTGCHALDEFLTVRGGEGERGQAGNNRGMGKAIAGGGYNNIRERPTQQHELLPSNNNVNTNNLLFGHVWKLSGDVGKTQLALQLAAAAMVFGSSPTTMTTKVDYLFSKGGHCLPALKKRHGELLKSIRENHPMEIDGQISTTKKNIDFVGITNATQLLYQLGIVEQELLLGEQQQNATSPNHRRLLVIDSISNINMEDPENLQYLIFHKCRLLSRLFPYRFGVIVVISNSKATARGNMTDLHLHISNLRTYSSYGDANNNNNNNGGSGKQQITTRQISIKLLEHPYQLVVPSPSNDDSSSFLSLKLTPYGITTNTRMFVPNTDDDGNDLFGG